VLGGPGANPNLARRVGERRYRSDPRDRAAYNAASYIHRWFAYLVRRP